MTVDNTIQFVITIGFLFALFLVIFQIFLIKENKKFMERCEDSYAEDAKFYKQYIQQIYTGEKEDNNIICNNPFGWTLEFIRDTNLSELERLARIDVYKYHKKKVPKRLMR